MQDKFELALLPVVGIDKINITDQYINQYAREEVITETYRGIRFGILDRGIYYITELGNLFYLVSKTCIDKLGIKGHTGPKMLHYSCEWGISFMNDSFSSILKIINHNTVNTTTQEATQEQWNQFIFKEDGDRKYLYDPLLFKQCQSDKRLAQSNYTEQDFWDAVAVRNVRNVNVERLFPKGSLIPDLIQDMNCGVFEIKKEKDYNAFINAIEHYAASTTNATSQTTLASNINTTEGWIGGLKEYLSKMATNAVNKTITNSTAEISESIFSDNAESWNETGINLINNTITNLTNTTLNTTDHSHANMFDYSDNDTSLVAQYMTIGTVVTASVMVIGAIGAGVTWYVRNQNSHKVLLQQYIDEIINATHVAEMNEYSSTAHHHLSDNDDSVVDTVGTSYTEDSAVVV